MKAQFLHWKDVIPLFKKESKFNFPPFTSPFLYVSTPKFNTFSSWVGKLLEKIYKILPVLKFKIFNIEIYKILLTLGSIAMIAFFIFNAKMGHDMGGGGVTLAIPGVTIPLAALFGMVVGVTMHELAHAGVMIENGYPPVDIGLIFLLFIPAGAGVRQSDDFEKKADPYIRLKVFMAGILMNFILFFLFIPLIFVAARVFESYVLTEMMIWAVMINFGFAMFNVLAIPPLDGYHIVKALAHLSSNKKVERKVVIGASVAVSIFLLLLNFGLISLFLR